MQPEPRYWSGLIGLTALNRWWNDTLAPQCTPTRKWNLACIGRDLAGIAEQNRHISYSVAERSVVLKKSADLLRILRKKGNRREWDSNPR
jgi:hypothetical protein